MNFALIYLGNGKFKKSSPITQQNVQEKAKVFNLYGEKLAVSCRNKKPLVPLEREISALGIAFNCAQRTATRHFSFRRERKKKKQGT